MKIKTTYSILLISLLVPIVQVQALDLSATTSINASSSRVELRREMKKENVENRMEVRADIQAKVGELKASIKESRTKKLDEKAKLRVETRLNNIYNMLTNRIKRLTRVDAEITKQLSLQTSTSSVLTLHVAAQTALAKAKVDIEATKKASISELNATTSKAILRNLVNTAEASIKNAAEAYKELVTLMPKVQVTASSTIKN